MPTSNTPSPTPTPTPTTTTVGRRAPLRLRLATHPGRDELDGAWWPRSRDLGIELADLVDHFPPAAGRVVRVLHSPPDWDRPTPRRVAVAGGQVKVGSFPRDDTHLVLLSTSDRRVLRVLVVPPGFSAAEGAEALLAGATAGNSHLAAELLEKVTDHLDEEESSHWNDDGGSFWDPHPVAPSYRTTS